jgi:hypothetical protein
MARELRVPGDSVAGLREMTRPVTDALGGMVRGALAGLFDGPTTVSPDFRPRRELWQLISQHVLDGRPFDPLILAWAASRHDAQQPGARESLAAMTLRLATSDTTPATARTLARALHADHICTTRLGVEWSNTPQQASAGAAQGRTARGPQARQAPDPVPDMSGSPASQQAPSGPRNHGRLPQRVPARTGTVTPERAPSSSVPASASPRPGGRPAAPAAEQVQVQRPPEPVAAGRAFGGGAQAAAAGVAVRHPQAAAVACAKRDGRYEHCGKRCR